MKRSKESIIRAAERYLKRTKAYQEHRDWDHEYYQLEYIISKGNITRAYAGFETTMISFNPLDSKSGYNYIDVLIYSFDDDLFNDLEKGYSLVGMTIECHYNIWASIEQGGIEYLEGMQKYLEYCKRNGITKDKLNKEVGYEGMDVMALYDKTQDQRKIARQDLGENR